MTLPNDQGDIVWGTLEGRMVMLVRVTHRTAQDIENNLIRAGIEQNPGPKKAYSHKSRKDPVFVCAACHKKVYCDNPC